MNKFKEVIGKLKENFKYNTKMKKEFVSVNIRRAFYFAIVAVFVHVTIILAFINNLSDIEDEIPYKWHMAIIKAHLIMLAIIVFFAVISFAAIKKKIIMNGFLANLDGVVMIMYLIFGAILSMIDQLVTSNITPLLIICVGAATLFITRPALAAIYYLITYIVFSNITLWTQHDKNVILSIRVNGVAAVAISFCVVYVLWRSNIINLEQKKLIERQKSELEEKNRQNEYFATHDTLTGLYNRMQFIQFAEKEISVLQRSVNLTCIIIMDIDHFKTINDTFGHPSGDGILKEIAKVLTKQLRKSDIIARLGGEEFIALLPVTTLEEGANVAEKLRTAVESYPFLIGDKSIKITISIGIAQIDISEVEPFVTGYQKADNALYLAKANGRNRIEIAC